MATLKGNSRDNQLKGTSGRDRLFGLDGNMQISRFFQSCRAASLAITIATAIMAPSLSIPSARAEINVLQIAQQLPDLGSDLPAGTSIPVRYDQEQIVLTPGETLPITLTVARNIINDRGNVVVPEGSRIEGELVPAGNGAQFIANVLILRDRNYRIPINATSAIVTRRETITRRTNPNLLEGAAIGGGAATVLAEVTGDIDLWEVLGGAGVGAIASLVLRGQEEVEVIIVNPSTDLGLEMRI